MFVLWEWTLFAFEGLKEFEELAKFVTYQFNFGSSSHKHLGKKVLFFTKILSYLPLALLSSYWQSRYSGYLIIRCWKVALYGFSVYKFQDLQNINISRHSIFFSGEKNLCRTMNKNVFRLLFNPEAMILSVYRSSY